MRPVIITPQSRALPSRGGSGLAQRLRSVAGSCPGRGKLLIQLRYRVRHVPWKASPGGRHEQGNVSAYPNDRAEHPFPGGLAPARRFARCATIMCGEDSNALR